MPWRCGFGFKGPCEQREEGRLKLAPSSFRVPRPSAVCRFLYFSSLEEAFPTFSPCFARYVSNDLDLDSDDIL